MPRYRIDLAYNGKPFFGWQRQPKQISVQKVIEDSLTKLNSNQPVEVVGCGRTDTGVHAKHYVLHTDLSIISSTDQYLYKLNKMLPSSIALFKMEQVKDDFHARFDAQKRTYRYFIRNKKNPFDENVWLLYRELDIELMNQASCLLIGKQDFTSFSKLHTDVKNNICEVFEAHWIKEEDTYIFEISANRFLRNMVRAIVGTLVDIGLKKLSVSDIDKILEKKDRQAASVSAPASGLFLWEIEY